MKIKEDIKQLLGQVLEELNLPHVEPEVEFSVNEKFGDLSANIAMKAYSQMKSESDSLQAKFSNPRELAEAICKQINEMKPEFGEEIKPKTKNPKLRGVKNLIKCEVAGPGFINFTLSEDFLLSKLDLVNKKKEGFGKTEQTNQKSTTQNPPRTRKYLVEHTSPNPNKAMHLGHLRTNLTGMAIANILEFSGHEVVRDCIDNNRGIAIAKLMWGYLKFASKSEELPITVSSWFENQDSWSTPEEDNLSPAQFVDQLYVKGNQDVSENKESEKIVRQMVVDWEAEDKATWALWEKVLDYSYQGQQQTLARLGNKWDKVWHEHEHYKAGKELVELGLKKGIFKQLDDGAIITQLEKDFGLTDTVLQKSDGTALYITQDLALTRLKKKTFQSDRMLWVIGPEQSLAMKQMFAACSQLGIGKYGDFIHIAYGFMSLKDQGKMSSRKGNVVYIDDLLDQSETKALEMIQNENLSEDEVARLAKQVGVGAVKYSVLRVGRMQDMAFDLEESISLQGNSGPYIQYTYARALSVLDKAKLSTSEDLLLSGADESVANSLGVLLDSQQILKDVDWSSLSIELNEEERAVLNWLWRFSDAVERATNEYSPHYIATYIYELAQRFNSFYNKHSILGGKQSTELAVNNAALDPSTSHDQTLLRLALTAATAQVLKNGLYLLGIEAPDRM